MAEQHSYQILPLGDAALLVQFKNVMDESINAKVLLLFRKLKALQLPFVLDVVPAYSSLAVYYDVYQLMQQQKFCSPFQYVSDQINWVIDNARPAAEEKQRLVQIPVCYAPSCAPDLADIAKQKNLSIEEVIRIHTAQTYTVYMIGFLPGFAYMGKVDDRIAVARKEQPKQHIEAGAVGIAGVQTGIYPLASPGGWQIIGRTPVPLFQKKEKEPVWLQPGDKVQFYAITENEFTHY